MGPLLYTKVRWLSRGRCLHRLYELRNEIEVFLQEKEANFQVQFRNEEFIIILAYLADVFGHFNQMNLSLQGCDVAVSDVKDKLAGLSAQMGVWQARLKIGFTASFLFLRKHLKMNRIKFPDKIKTCMKSSVLSFDLISTTHFISTHLFYGTKTRSTLKLTLWPKKQRS